MKKTIFRGTVNGVEYNTIEDYNTAVNKAVENGNTVTACTSTEIYDDLSEQEIEDILTIKHEDLFPIKLCNVEKFVESIQDDDIESFTEKTLRNVINTVKKYKDQNRDIKTLKKAIEDYVKQAEISEAYLEDELEKLDEEIRIIQSDYDNKNNQWIVTDEIINCYKEILDKMLNEECGCDNCDECKCKKGQKENPTIDDLIKGFKELLDEIC